MEGVKWSRHSGPMTPDEAESVWDKVDEMFRERGMTHDQLYRLLRYCNETATMHALTLRRPMAPWRKRAIEELYESDGTIRQMLPLVCSENQPPQKSPKDRPAKPEPVQRSGRRPWGEVAAAAEMLRSAISDATNGVPTGLLSARVRGWADVCDEILTETAPE